MANRGIWELELTEDFKRSVVDMLLSGGKT